MVSDLGNFAGHPGRDCGEHRTLGGRAWCFDCSEYCYPSEGCMGCETPRLRSEIEKLRALLTSCVGSEKDPCEFDHHGNCQAHGSFLTGDEVGPSCHVAEARALLGLKLGETP